MAIPLKDIKFEINVLGGIMELMIIQEYENVNKSAVECEYVFPVGMEMALHSLEIRIGEKVIRGKIEEKEEAELRYEDAVAEGHNPVKMEYREGMNDIVSMKIGKLTAGKSVQVRVGVAQKLEVSNHTYVIRLPTTYTPRYHSSQEEINFPSQGVQHIPQNLVPGKKVTYSWTMDINIHSPAPILLVHTPRKERLSVEYNADRTMAKGQIVCKEIPNRDLIIYYSHEGMEEPSLMLQWSEKLQEFAGVFWFWPKFKSSKGVTAAVDIPMEDIGIGTKVEEESKDPVESKAPEAPETPEAPKAPEVEEYDMMESVGEHIFILDCSGSMRGNRIKTAKEACILFLHSLPMDSKFNIIFFGNAFRSIFPTPLPYTEQHLQEAIIQVEKQEATMGGTEILPALVSIFSTAVDALYPRNIYLLTDGAVSNPEGVIEVIRKENHSSRTHTLGIGEGASGHLVMGAAHAGRGGYQFCADGEDIAPKVISSLSMGCKPALTSPTLNWGVHPTNISIQYPMEHRTQTVFLDEPFYAFAIFKLPLDEHINIQFQATDTRNGGEVKTFAHNFQKEKCVVKGEGLFNMTAKYLLNYNELLTEAQKVQLSLRYSVLAQETAFVGIEKIKGKDFEEVTPVKIPVSLTKDYEDKPQHHHHHRGRGRGGFLSLQGRGGPTSNIKMKKGLSKGAMMNSKSSTRSSRTGIVMEEKERKKSAKVEYDMEECMAPDSDDDEDFAVGNVLGEGISGMPIKSEIIITDYHKIVELQKFGGEWVLEEWLCKTYTKTIEELKELISENLRAVGLSEDDLLNVWATILTLKLLNTKYPADKAAWNMVEKKALIWLKRKKITPMMIEQISLNLLAPP